MNGFTFQSPWFFLLLLPVLAFAGVLFISYRSGERIRKMLGGAENRSRRWICVPLVAALIFLVLALAEPGINPHLEVLERGGRDLIFMLDVSRSMLAEDAHPSRLEAARSAIADVVREDEAGRYALVAFAGSAAILCPLTSDRAFLKSALGEVGPHSAAVGSTLLQPALDKVLDKVIDEGRRGLQDIVLLTDGEDQGSKVLDAAGKLNGVRLLIVGLGDEAGGARIPMRDEQGTLRFQEDQGNQIWTSLQSRSLRELAAYVPGSLYVAAGTASFNLPALYRDFSAGNMRVDVDDGPINTVYDPLFFFFLVAALLGLIVPFVRPYWRYLMPLLVCMWTGAGFGAEEVPLPHDAVSAFQAGTALQQGGGNEKNVLQFFARAELLAANPALLAASRHNQACIYFKQAQNDKGNDPEKRLLLWLAARDLWLGTLRARPDHSRARGHLAAVLERIAADRVLLEKKRAAEKTFEEQLKHLVERLQKVTKQQQDLAFRSLSLEQRSTLERTLRLRLHSNGLREQQTIISELNDLLTGFHGAREHFVELFKSITQGLQADAMATPLDGSIGYMKKAAAAQTRALSAFGLKHDLPAADETQQAAEALRKALEPFLKTGQQSADQHAEEHSGEQSGEPQNNHAGGAQSGAGDLRTAEARGLPKVQMSAEQLLKEEAENKKMRRGQEDGAVADTPLNW